MLPKNRISGIKILSDEWKQARLGKFTSSKIISLMGEKPYQTGFMSYIYQKVGEELTGVPVDDEESFFETDAMRWGLKHEAGAITKFGQQMGLDFLVTQQLIYVPDTRFGCTPDGFVIHNESVDKLSYNVSTVEVKCFPTYRSYIMLALCNTPQDVKKAHSTVYWQVLDQMDNCDCLTGYCVAYHPNFKAGNLNIVEFRKAQLIEDFKLLKERKKMATEKFEEVRDILISKGKV